MRTDSQSTSTIYSAPNCMQCVATKREFDKRGLSYSLVDVSVDDSAREMLAGMGYRSAPVVIAAKRFIADGATVVYVVNTIAVAQLGASLAAEMIAHPEISEPLFAFLEQRAELSTFAQLARLHAELACDIDHPRAPPPSTNSVPVLRIDETGLDEHDRPIWHSRTWFPPGAMSFELIRHRSRTFA